jgi:hypothetical protein
MHKIYRTTAYAATLGLLTVSAFAQERPTVEQVQQQLEQLAAADAANAAGAPADSQQPVGDPQAIPPRLTIKAGTYVTVRLNEGLSSDHSQAGDAFTATLMRPIVVDGVVVATVGQNVIGHVTEAKKAGRVSGTSRLGIQLVELPAVDGQQLAIQSELISRNGPTSVGRDAGALAATTATGAAIGAAVGWGVGAGIGAAAGFVAGLTGVLVTRGEPTILYPETVMTFRVNQDIPVSTEHNLQAFRFVQPSDYEQHAPALQRRPPPPPRPAYGYAPYPPYGAPYPYAYPYYGGYPFPAVGFYYGPRYYYGRRW